MAFVKKKASDLVLSDRLSTLFRRTLCASAEPVSRSACWSFCTLRIVSAAGAGVPQPPAERTPIVYTAEVDGIIHPVATAYIRRAIAEADAAKADLLVIVLRTPGRPRRLDARHQHRHHPVEDAGRRLRVALGQPRRVGGLPHHHRRRRRGDGARHAHRRRASGVGRRPEGRRHDGQEDDVRRRRIRADDSPRSASATSRWSSRRSPRAGPSPSRRRRAAESAAHRPHRRRSARPAEEARRPDHPPLRRRRSQTLRTPGAERRTVEMTWAQKVLSAVAHPQIAYLLLMLGTLGLTVEMWNPRLDPAGRRRRDLPAAGVLRLPGAAGQLRRRPADPLRARPAHPRGQGHELRPARGRRHPQPVLRVDPADGLAVTRAAGRAAAHRPGDADAVGHHPLPRPAGGQSPAQSADYGRGRHARERRAGADVD